MKSPIWPGISLALVIALGIVSYLHWFSTTNEYHDANRDALPIEHDFAGDSATRIVFLDQGWSPQKSVQFYNTPQGSRLVPHTWFQNLEQPNKEALFLAPEYIARFRYLPQTKSQFNPDGLPVGFVKDPASGWMGPTCAACHTTQINYKKTGIRIDGAPGLGDFNGLLLALTEALNQTFQEQARFDRFSHKVLGDTWSEQEAKILKEQLKIVVRLRQEYNKRNLTSTVGLGGADFGFGRVDAFGAILNQVMENALKWDANHRDANAPVSYPCLWDTPQHDVVQWNGVAPNKNGGSLARNVGEVLGVFGELEIPASIENPFGYASSARIPDLLFIEKQLAELWSPVWPENILPPLDRTKVKAGGTLYAKYCVACHLNIDRKDPGRQIVIMNDDPSKSLLRDIGTDKAMAENFRLRLGDTRQLKGTQQPPLVGAVLKDKAKGDEILVNVVIGSILHSPFSGPKDPLGTLHDRQMRTMVGAVETKLNRYKARPLNGIWATAPYLHNGSVPNLYELLQPGTKRVSTFHVGRREFDPEKVGFITDAAEGTFLFKTRDDKGHAILGNSNLGHEYGTGVSLADGGDGEPALTPTEIGELLEYLKSL